MRYFRKQTRRNRRAQAARVGLCGFSRTTLLQGELPATKHLHRARRTLPAAADDDGNDNRGNNQRDAAADASGNFRNGQGGPGRERRRRGKLIQRAASRTQASDLLASSLHTQIERSQEWRKRQRETDPSPLLHLSDYNSAS